MDQTKPSPRRRVKARALLITALGASLAACSSPQIPTNPISPPCEADGGPAGCYSLECGPGADPEGCLTPACGPDAGPEGCTREACVGAPHDGCDVKSSCPPGVACNPFMPPPDGGMP
jgi:hypothetical protein